MVMFDDKHKVLPGKKCQLYYPSVYVFWTYLRSTCSKSYCFSTAYYQQFLSFPNGKGI